MPHEKCVTGWLIFTQPMSHLHGGFAEPRTTGDVYLDESFATRNMRACSNADQASWLKKVMIHHCH